MPFDFAVNFENSVRKNVSKRCAFIREKWHEPFGDMRQELVFIGQGMDPAHTRRALDACLLSEDETRAGLEYWRTLPDPFPDWGLEEAS